MKIANESVVSFHFTLKNDRGEVIESSEGQEPLVYLHGAHAIEPGLEEALDGRVAGDKFSVSLAPEKAYGQRDEKLIQVIPKNQFPEPDQLVVGMQFQVQTPGGVMLFTIKNVAATEVTVDGNPELAGQTLNFDIEVSSVRQASKAELEHGHAHGPGGHHH